MPIENDAAVAALLKHAKSIAVVGASPKPWRDSGAIMLFLATKGYETIPVNPLYSDVLGYRCFPDLASIGKPPDIVNVFRRPDAVLPVVEEAIRMRAGAVWMQLDVVNEEAARRAEEAGLQVVMDRCIAVEYRRLVR